MPEQQERQPQPWEGQFFETLRETGNIRSSARAAGIGRATAYRYRAYDDFRAAWDEALDDAVDMLEAEAWRRAKDGVEKPVFHGGQQVGTVREYSNNLLQFLLRAHRPAKYRDNARVEVTGADGKSIKHEHRHEHVFHDIAALAQQLESLEQASVEKGGIQADGNG